MSSDIPAEPGQLPSVTAAILQYAKTRNDSDWATLVQAWQRVGVDLNELDELSMRRYRLEMDKAIDAES